MLRFKCRCSEIHKQSITDWRLQIRPAFIRLCAILPSLNNLPLQRRHCPVKKKITNRILNSSFRFSTEKFSLTDLHNPFCHLTNSSLNKLGPGYADQKGGIGAGKK